MRGLFRVFLRLLATPSRCHCWWIFIAWVLYFFDQNDCHTSRWPPSVVFSPSVHCHKRVSRRVTVDFCTYNFAGLRRPAKWTASASFGHVLFVSQGPASPRRFGTFRSQSQPASLWSKKYSNSRGHWSHTYQFQRVPPEV